MSTVRSGRGTDSSDPAQALLVAAGGSRWSRPDLTASFGRLAAEQARDDGTWAVAAGWTLHGRAAIGDARDDAAAVLAQLDGGARRTAVRSGGGARLRAELAGVARDHGSAEVARRLLDGLLRDPGTPVDVRFDALVARARASLSDGPDRLGQLLSPIDAAAREVAGHAAAATAELLRAAAERAQARHHTAADRARTAMALLGWSPGRPTAETESDHLTAALATQWIGALLDAGALGEARAAADELSPRLDADGLPSRQLAQLRLTCARATSRPSGTIEALERAAADAGAAGAPDLESACRAALAELLDASGRRSSAREQLRLRRRADEDDRRRADRFRAATPLLAGLLDDTTGSAAGAGRRRADRPVAARTTRPAEPRAAGGRDGVRRTRDVLSGTALDAAVPVAHDPFVGTPLAPDTRRTTDRRATPPAGNPLGSTNGAPVDLRRTTPRSGGVSTPLDGTPVRPTNGAAPDGGGDGARRNGRAASSYMSSPMGDALMAELRGNGSVTDSAWGDRDEVSRFRRWNAEVAEAAERVRAQQAAVAERAARAAEEKGAAAQLASPPTSTAPVEEPVAPALAVTDTAAAAADWLAKAIADIDEVWGRPEEPKARRHRAPEQQAGAPERNGAAPTPPSGRRRRRAAEDDAGTATNVVTGRAAGARFRSAIEASALRAAADEPVSVDPLVSTPVERPALSRSGRRARREAAERAEVGHDRTDEARPLSGSATAAVSVVVDLVSGDERVGGAAVAVALRRIARRAGATLPAGATLRGGEDTVTVEFPGLDRAGAAAWVHSVLEDLAAGLPTARDLDGAFLRAAVVGADGVRGVQILHDLGTQATASAVTETGGTAVERVAAARAARRITGPPGAVIDGAVADTAPPDPTAAEVTTRFDELSRLPEAAPDAPPTRTESVNRGGRHRERADGAGEAPERGGRHRGRRPDGDTPSGPFASTQDPDTGAVDVDTEEPRPATTGGRRRRREPIDVAPPAASAPAADVVEEHTTEPAAPPGAEPLPQADAAEAEQEEPDIESLGLAELLAGAMAAYRGM
ncbi:MAG: hypothetical protein J0I34_20310 [Pseudonocardia sp.]|uniref:hypothetical protein n=1 Tax=Pseudonocardia sp. TaxID=60912 RepID=UPI00086F6C4B|nr:hypothetical protein [Pseudonocardia sp.]MBN9111115.1 hypothetical protein [Pseudonocardia sp.]ODU23796.1 MAG: hypothetical protein ABS80_13940 [Pseudonocardia sp. SCN 72-51]